MSGSALKRIALDVKIPLLVAGTERFRPKEHELFPKEYAKLDADIANIRRDIRGRLNAPAPLGNNFYGGQINMDHVTTAITDAITFSGLGLLQTRSLHPSLTAAAKFIEGEAGVFVGRLPRGTILDIDMQSGSVKAVVLSSYTMEVSLPDGSKPVRVNVRGDTLGGTSGRAGFIGIGGYPELKTAEWEILIMPMVHGIRISFGDHHIVSLGLSAMIEAEKRH